MATGLDVLCEREESGDRVRSALGRHHPVALVALALARRVRLFDEGFDPSFVFGGVVEEAASGMAVSTCAASFCERR